MFLLAISKTLLLISRCLACKIILLVSLVFWDSNKTYLVHVWSFSFNSHTAAIAAGNNGIPVRMHGHEFGKASGMAPRAR
jgi:hypothetical protein